MSETTIYSDIATRTGGEIYIGVVGPVRTGKSTFIKQFLDTLVIPNMESEYIKERTLDEIPQSAEGRTVMTTEPKFIPNDEAKITLESGVSFGFKMIDCVGYTVPGALGLHEDDKPRMVMTPWQSSPIPFDEAARIGTDKVIREHSTVGIVITTDSSFTPLSREDYMSAEDDVISEMKKTGKPFTIILNSAHPDSESAVKIADSISEKHGVDVIRMNLLAMSKEDISDILQKLLYEFPVTEMRFRLPLWVSTLSESHPLRTRIADGLCEKAQLIHRLCEVKKEFDEVYDEEFGTGIHFTSIDPSNGTAKLGVSVPRELFYKILADESGLDIKDDRDLAQTVTSLAASRKKYEKFAAALDDVESTGYGIVTPCIEDLTLEEPEIVKQAGSYGVKLRASAPSIHIMCNKPKFLKTA